MKPPASIYAAVLGIQLTAAMSNIIGGELAGNGAAPYIVSIRQGGNHTCGGSLISDRLVVTAGHCLVDVVPRSLTVVAGSNSLRQGGVERNVSEGIIHPDFDLFRRLNDIGLIKLAKPFYFTDVIRPIEIQHDNKIRPGTNVSIYGWGYTTFPPSFPPEPKPTELHVVNRNTISTADCYKAYKEYDGKNVTDRQICTQSGGHGTCNGDSGGPLVWTNEDNMTYLVGLVSFGVPCANQYPDVFTKVWSYLQWIKGNSA